MHPILFQFGPLTIYAYGLMVAIGFIAATVLIKRQAPKQNIPPEKVMDLCLLLVISAILGARTFYVLQNLDIYIKHPLEIVMLQRGGLSFYGGFIGAVICGIIFLKRQNLTVLETFDLIAVYLPLAQAIGRIGCFLNGCCYGKPASHSLAVYFPGENIARHPVQIYASLNLLLIFIILLAWQKKVGSKTYFSGQIFLLYCLLYSAMRFMIEFLRGDHLPIFANLTIHQLISLGVFVISGFIWWKKCKNPA